MGGSMSNIILTGDTSGTLNLAAPTIAGTNTQTLVAATGTLAPIVSGTAVASTSGTSIDFTGIPSWVKRVTVMFQGVSTNGVSYIQIQLGTSGGIEASSYLGTASTVAASSVGSDNISTGFWVRSAAATGVRHGQFVISLINPSTNSWVASGVLGYSDTTITTITGGSKSLSGTLDRVRITTQNGTDTFDAGTINILYE